VIETTSFKRWGLDDNFYTNPTEYRMHSDALKTVERVAWKSEKTLSYILTIDDAKIFARAWSQEFQITASPNGTRPACTSTCAKRTTTVPAGGAKASRRLLGNLYIVQRRSLAPVRCSFNADLGARVQRDSFHDTQGGRRAVDPARGHAISRSPLV
jgi:hypothetical protein